MYWNGCGEQFTKQTLEMAIEREKEEELGLVIPSNSGKTVFEALSLGARADRIVCVTHMVGFRNPGEDEMGEENRRKLKEAGVRVLTTTHVLAGVDRALRLAFGGVYPPEIVANSLRMLGQGVKVGVEIAIMATDAGLIKPNKKVIALGGSGRGVDTAIVVSPAHSTQLFEVKVHEIMAKPRVW